MAPVLVCPECSTKHPLGDIGERTAFPCTGCGRQLKVPAAAHTKQTVPPSREPVAPPRAPRPEPETPRDAVGRAGDAADRRDAARAGRPRARAGRDPARSQVDPAPRDPLPVVDRRGAARVPRRPRARAWVSACSRATRSRTSRSPKGGVASGRSRGWFRSLPSPPRCSCRAAPTASRACVSGGGQNRPRRRRMATASRRRTGRARGPRSDRLSRPVPARSSQPRAGATPRSRSHRRSGRGASA